MRHLTVDEMIDFVSMDRINAETLKLASTVNAHIGQCEKCLRKIRAYQLVYDEFVKLGKASRFDQAIRSVDEKRARRVSPDETDRLVSDIENDNGSLSHCDKNKF